MSSLSASEKSRKVRKYCQGCKKFHSEKNSCVVFNEPYPLWGDDDDCWAREAEESHKEDDLSFEEKMKDWKEVWWEDRSGRPGLKFGKSESYDEPLFPKNRWRDNRKIDSRGKIRCSRMAEDHED